MQTADRRATPRIALLSIPATNASGTRRNPDAIWKKAPRAFSTAGNHRSASLRHRRRYAIGQHEIRRLLLAVVQEPDLDVSADRCRAQAFTPLGEWSRGNRFASYQNDASSSFIPAFSAALSTATSTTLNAPPWPSSHRPLRSNASGLPA